MALSIKDYTIIKVLQAPHHQGDVRYVTTRGIQCSCMSLMSVSWTLLRFPDRWDKLDLDGMLGKGDQLFKSLGKFRYLGMEDLPQEIFLEGLAVNVQFLEIKMGEITTGVYLLSIVDIIYNVQQIGTGALLIVNDYILDLIWGNYSIYLFDSHSKNENGNVSSSGTAVLIKFDRLLSLENYIRSVYYNAYPLTLYFQMQFIKLDCTVNARIAIKCSLKKEILLARGYRDLKAKKKKYHDEPEQKRQAVKK